MTVRRTILACTALALSCVAVRWFGCVSPPDVGGDADRQRMSVPAIDRSSATGGANQRTARTFDLPVTISGTAEPGTVLVRRTWGDLNGSGTVDLFDAAKLQQGWVEYKAMQSDPLYEPKATSIRGTWAEMVDQWRGPLVVIR